MMALTPDQLQERSTAVGALIYRPGRGLYLQRQRQNRGYCQESWDMPTTTMAKHESVPETLARQIQGETGWTLKDVKALLGHRVWNDGEPEAGQWRSHWVDEYDFLVTVEEDSAPTKQSDEIQGWQWLTRDDLAALERSEKKHVHAMVKNAMDYLGL